MMYNFYSGIKVNFSRELQNAKRVWGIYSVKAYIFFLIIDRLKSMLA